MAVTAEEVLAWLRENASDEVREGMTRYGIPNDRAFGIGMGDLKRYAKRAGRDHAVALELWETGWYEARTVAALVAEPDRLTVEEMDAWAGGFDSWAICDTTCFSLFDRSPLAWDRVTAWADAGPEFTKRASFALVWGLSVHDKSAPDDPFLDALTLIERAAPDDRTYVKKGVNMALRAVGKRNRALNRAAIASAERLAGREESAARWIGSHALRELRSEKVQGRLG